MYKNLQNLFRFSQKGFEGFVFLRFYPEHDRDKILIVYKITKASKRPERRLRKFLWSFQ